jgi:hypothetical protein
MIRKAILTGVHNSEANRPENSSHRYPERHLSHRYPERHLIE